MNSQFIRAVRDYLHRFDYILFGLVMLCCVFGLVVVASAVDSFNDSKLMVQILAFIIGIAIYIIFTVIDADVLADFWPFMLALEVGLILLLIPFGQSGGTGNTGWIRFGSVGIQPSEFVKIMFIVLTAKHATYLKEYKNINSLLSLVQLTAHFLLIFGLLLVISSDLGSCLVFMFVFLIMLFAAGVKLYWFFVAFAGMAVVIPLAWNNFFTERQKQRILAPYDSTIDPDGYGINWQPHHAKLALSSGRLTGEGLFNGTQTQSGAVESKHADFIFASLGEELGMIGCCAALLLLCLVIIRCVVVGVRCRSTFGMLICFGVAAMLFFQTFENIGMCIGLTPVIGLTLPFFSYGGSSLLATLAGVGLVSGIFARPKPAHPGYSTLYDL